MASNAAHTESAPTRPGPFEALAANPQQVQVTLLLLIFALVCVPVTLLVVSKGWALSPQLAVFVTSLLTVEVLVAVLIYFMPNERSSLLGADRLRVLALTIATLIGANAAFLGLLLPFTAAIKPAFANGIESWRTHKGSLLLCGGLLFGGLALMFLGVQLARRFERTRSDMRRALYGVNALNSVALLLASLVLLNVLPYSGVKPFTWFEKTIDWTSSKMYTLSDKSREFLAGLKKPVTVYILMPNETERREVSTLLDNCRNVTEQISWQYVSRDRDSAKLLELQRKYPSSLRSIDGLLIVYGSGEGELSEFVKTQDMFSAGVRGESFQFKGEGALVKTIEYLESGKAKAKVYFTQGNGELEINARPGAVQGESNSMGELWRRLGLGNYELKELRFSPDVTSVPEDADVVVIAQPNRKFTETALKALSQFLREPHGPDKKKGKMFVLFAATKTKDDWVKTGLEDLVKQFNVQVNEDRVLDWDEQNPANLFCVTDPRSTSTPMGRAFWYGPQNPIIFNLRAARSVEPLAAASGYTAQSLVVASSGTVWVEKNQNYNAATRATELRNSEKLQQELGAKGPVSVAVTVTQSRGDDRMAAAHGLSSDQQPCLVVFGDASWIEDAALNDKHGNAHFALFGACVSWLRERPDITPERGADRPVYELNSKAIDPLRLFFQPLGLMVLGVIGLGGAVWVARRR